MRLSELARAYDRIGAARNDPERIKLLSALLARADAATLAPLAHFTLGEAVLPQFSDRLGVGPGAIRDALARLTGRDAAEINEEVKRTGDLSEVAAAALPHRGGTLTVAGLWRLLAESVEGDGDRQALVESVLSRAGAGGAKYFVRMALGQMRIGVGTGTLLRAIAAAFGVEAGSVERVYTLTNDVGLAAAAARRGERALARAGLTLFRPYQFMNAHKVDDPADIFRALAGRAGIFEIKYDGARLQIHVGRGGEADAASVKVGARAASAKKGRGRPSVRLYSRRLNDDTAAMPDIVAALQKAWRGGEAIVEGEAVAFDPTLKKKLPFQSVLMRLGRVHGIEEKAAEIPLVLFLFDLLYEDGEDLMRVPQSERRARLERLFRPTERVKMTEALVTDRPEAQARYFREVVRAGHEGLMAKDPAGVYLPGRRAEQWMKIKPAFETLDVVVVGGIYGSGRRRGLLSSLIVAVRHRDEFLTVGKVGTGFSEDYLRDLTARLEPSVTAARGAAVELEPRVVIEVDFQDIQKTGRYRAGYVLRIPRFKRERTDKSPREADTVERLRRLYRQTHG